MTDRAVALVHATTGATEGPKLAAKLLRSSGFRVHTKPRKATPYQVVLTDQPPAFLDRKAFLAAFGIDAEPTVLVVGPERIGKTALERANPVASVETWRPGPLLERLASVLDDLRFAAAREPSDDAAPWPDRAEEEAFLETLRREAEADPRKRSQYQAALTLAELDR